MEINYQRHFLLNFYLTNVIKDGIGNCINEKIKGGSYEL